MSSTQMPDEPPIFTSKVLSSAYGRRVGPAGRAAALSSRLGYRQRGAAYGLGEWRQVDPMETFGGFIGGKARR